MNTQPHWVQAIDTWMLWVMFTGIGWPVGLILSKVLVVIGLKPQSGEFEQLISLVIGGMVTAYVQLIYLSPDVRGAGLWVVVTTLGWVCGAGVTWLFGQEGESFYRFGWLLSGLIGGLLYGSFQWIGFQPWETPPVTWMSQSAIRWLSAYALGVILLGDQSFFHLTEFLFISWAVLGLIMLIVNLLIIPKPRRFDPVDLGPWWPSQRE